MSRQWHVAHALPGPRRKVVTVGESLGWASPWYRGEELLGSRDRFRSVVCPGFSNPFGSTSVCSHTALPCPHLSSAVHILADPEICWGGDGCAKKRN